MAFVNIASPVRGNVVSPSEDIYSHGRVSPAQSSAPWSVSSAKCASDNSVGLETTASLGLGSGALASLVVGTWCHRRSARGKKTKNAMQRRAAMMHAPYRPPELQEESIIQLQIDRADNAVELLAISSAALPWFNALHSSSTLYKMGVAISDHSVDGRVDPSMTVSQDFINLVAFHTKKLEEFYIPEFSYGGKGDRAIANSAVAYGTLRPMAPQVHQMSWPIAILACDRIPKMQGSFMMKAIVNIVYGFALAKEKNALVNRVLKTAIERIGRGKVEVDNIACSTILWAFAILDYKDDEAMKLFSYHVLKHSAAHDLGNWDICACVWAFEELGYAEEYPVFLSLLNTEMKERGLTKADVNQARSGPCAFLVLY